MTPEELDEITAELGREYKAWKKGEKNKNDAKKKFFEAIDKMLGDETPAIITTQVFADSDLEAEQRAVQRYPGYTPGVLIGPAIEGDPWTVTLEEDPTLRPYTYISSDGMVYSRQVVSGSPMLDDERLRDEDPELWEAITHIPQERVMKPLEELSDDQLAALSDFMYSGKPTVKLGAPRKAKPEELEVE